MSSTTTNLVFTPLNEIGDTYARVTKKYKSGATRPLTYRRQQLLQLARMLQENADAFQDAIDQDLGKQRFEFSTAELGPVIKAAVHAAENLEEWTKPEKPQVEEWRSAWNTTVYKVPKGVALIISPWNYPVILTFNPLVGAIAAGCSAVMKPSEVTPATSALMAKLVPNYLDPDAYVIVNGAVNETTALLNLRWDHIFFTGGGKIGRIVAAAAAKNVTPLTLELGGKSPVVIDTDTDIELAAKRVLYGKLQNSGQLCVSPDYVLVSSSVSAQFKEALKKAYSTFFPTHPVDPDSKWSKIVNPVHHRRLKDLLDRTKGDKFLGGEFDGEARIAPTVVTGVKLDDPVMEDEIFGPILPVIEVKDADEAIQIIADRPTPLTLYAFTNNQELKQKIVERTNSGSLVFNDTYMQLAVHEVPFGGHGDSGYGAYVGKQTFNTFTHTRSSIDVPLAAEPHFALRYPPYSDEAYKVLAADVNTKIPTA